jgi:tRNA(fMet)-specific endonuclease VapC
VAQPRVTDPVIVDSDLVIDFLRGRGPGAALVRELLAAGRLRLTAVTAFELRVGADFAAREASIAPLFLGRTLPLDAEATLRAGAIWSELRAGGVGIGPADTLQAGVALRFGLRLATRNVRHFSRIPGLTLADVGAP